MKKLVTGILTAVLVLGVGVTSAFAAGRGCHFRDEYNDGVCNFAYTSCTFVDADEDGICDNCGINIDEMGYSRHYIDADNDGVCDNYTEGVCPQNGAGRGYGCRRGHNR